MKHCLEIGDMVVPFLDHNITLLTLSTIEKSKDSSWSVTYIYRSIDRRSRLGCNIDLRK